MKFHFITVVWGKDYSDLFTSIAIPNQLSSHNLPLLAKRNVPAIYKIYTTDPDAKWIRQAQSFIKLSETLPVEILELEGLHLDKYQVLSKAHQTAIEDANRSDAAIIILSPDSIWSNGTFEQIVSFAESGKRAIMVAGIRVIKETFVPELIHKFASDNGERIISPSGRELVSLALDHFHPLTKSLFWNSTNASEGSHLYWQVGTEGFIVRGFHLHPLMIYPRDKTQPLVSTVDNDYVALVCSEDEIFVVEDSDCITGIEISKESQFGTFPPKRLNTQLMGIWVAENTNWLHRKFSTHKIRFRAVDALTSPLWESIENESDKVIEEINRLSSHWMIVLRRFWRMVKHSIKIMLGR
jgi:hypothetical protein